MMKSGRTNDAELEFKQLALAYPDLAGPEVNLGLLYLRAARYPEAEAAFNAALARNPDNAIANDELGIVERKLGKFAEAEAAYQHTIAVEPNYAPAYLNLGVLYDLYLAQPQKALAALVPAPAVEEQHRRRRRRVPGRPQHARHGTRPAGKHERPLDAARAELLLEPLKTTRSI